MLNDYSGPESAPAVIPLLERRQPRRSAPKYRSSAPELVARAAHGEPQALARLLEEQRSRIVALARFFTGRNEDAEDLAQDILLRMVQALPTLGSADTFDVWIYRLSRNRCIDHFRRRRLEAGWPSEPEPTVILWRDDVVPPDLALEASQSARRLRAAIRALPRVWRTAIVLRDLQDLPYEEVAARLGVPIGTVKSRINRGRARLAAALTAGRATDPTTSTARRAAIAADRCSATRR